jgi:hypothetical protein
MTTTVARPTVFEANVPTVSYEDAPSAYEAHRRIAEARSLGPIAMGAHGPELLRYELARTALRDHRMCVPQGLGLEAQGITSAAVGSGGFDAAQRQRRGPLAAAAPGVEGIHTACGRQTRHDDHRHHHRTGRAAVAHWSM